MNGEYKPEFPSLLPIGRHKKSVEEIRALCVVPFEMSSTRPAIMAGLLAVIEAIRAAGIVGELWVDGSFLTSKVDPEDVDVVLRISSWMDENCTQEQRDMLDLVAGDLHDSHHCHSFVFTEWPEGHDKYWQGEYAYAYWMRQWGFGRNSDPKGIAVVEFTGVANE